MYATLKLNPSNHTPINPNPIRRNVQNDSVSMLRRITLSNINNQQRRQTIIKQQLLPNSFLNTIKPISPPSTMAENTKSNPPPSPAVTEDKEKKKVEPPTPPEKPEAGDCCGSGCVRCVWDIYYDELESYNLLLKEFNDTNTTS